MAKRKRGGFSFFDTKRPAPRPQPPKQVKRGITTKAPALRIIENRAGSIDMLSWKESVRKCFAHVCDMKDVEFSRVFTGESNHRYFYVYFYLTEVEINKALEAFVEKFQRSLNKAVVATYLHDAYTETLVAPPVPKPSISNVVAFNIQKKPSGQTNRRETTDKPAGTQHKPMYDIGERDNSYIWYNESILDTILSANNYGELFGINNVPEKLLKEVVRTLKGKSMRQEYAKTLKRSSSYTFIQIDDTSYNFTIRIELEEFVQNRGNAQKQNCSFKKETAYLLVEPDSQTILLLSSNRKRSAIIFNYVGTEWQMVAFVLYSYFRSECRYKRSYIPVSLLKALGVRKMTKAYKRLKEKTFASGKWFPIQNSNNGLQLRYYNELNMKKRL